MHWKQSEISPDGGHETIPAHFDTAVRRNVTEDKSQPDVLPCGLKNESIIASTGMG
jgi:hypothetical protein